MRLIVGNGQDQGPVGARYSGEIGHVGGDPVGEQQHVAPRLEPARGFGAIADRGDDDLLGAQALDRGIERKRHPLDQHHDRRRTGGGGTARLIFEQGVTGERKQSAKPARIVFLIGPDQRTKRHALTLFASLTTPAPP